MKIQNTLENTKRCFNVLHGLHGLLLYRFQKPKKILVYLCSMHAVLPIRHVICHNDFGPVDPVQCKFMLTGCGKY